MRVCFSTDEDSFTGLIQSGQLCIRTGMKANRKQQTKVVLPWHQGARGGRHHVTYNSPHSVK